MVKDWREFKRLETEKREEQERERQSLAKKLTLTCRSHVSQIALLCIMNELIINPFSTEFGQWYIEKQVLYWFL